MRSAARKVTQDDPEPGRDLAAEAIALIAEDIRRQKQTQRQLAMIATALAERDSAEIGRLSAALMLTGIWQDEGNGKTADLAAALRDEAAASFASDAMFAAGWDARGRQLAAQVPVQRRATGQQHPLMRLVQD